MQGDSYSSWPLLYECVLQLRVNNQCVLPTVIETIDLLLLLFGVELVYWILWLILGKLVLVGHSKSISISNATDVDNFILRSYVAYPGYSLILE